MATMLVLGSAAAHAAGHTSAGCGWGTMLFDGKNKKAHLILAATTNGTFGNQTFGISSETAGCTSDGSWVKADKKVEAYTAANFQRISTEMAQGGGEYLNGLSALLGAKDAAAQKAFAEKAQKNYEKIIPNEKTDAVAMLNNLRAVMSL
ncbi:MAG TPA: DUF3015 family protein [Elusimicrobiota bacterium]|nr:DUF3015 family protein [Elusimicrobiota bacterium]